MTRRARTVSHPNDAKRVRLATNASECQSYEMLVDPEYPLELVAENLERVLAYEGQVGIQELLSLIARSIGCVDVEITTLEELENSCVSVAPVSYPMQRRDYASRISDTLREVMDSSESKEVTYSVINTLEYLSHSSLRSLRHCAVALLAVCDEGNSNLADRANDVASTIRELSVGACKNYKVIERNLNDPVAGGRLAAVRALESAEALVENWIRLVDMAKFDTDMRVRREACRLVSRHAPVDTALGVLGLVDERDAGLRRAAAIACWRLMNLQPESKHPGMNPHINKVLWIASNVKPRSVEAATAIADATRGNINMSDVSDTILSDIAARNRRLASLQAQNLGPLLVLLHGFAISERIHTDKSRTHRERPAKLALDLLSLIPRLCERLSHNEILLSRAIAITSAVDMDSVVRFGLEKQLEILLFALDAAFTEHPVPEVLEACSKVFKDIPEDLRRAPLLAMLSEVRMQLATALGPPGSHVEGNTLKPHVMQILVLARFVPIAEVANLPVWDIRELVRAIGLQAAVGYDEPLVRKCIAELDVEAALEILTIAKLKGVELLDHKQPEVSAGQVSSRVWQAAVGAGIF